jgi:hypothetical protein
VVEAQCRRPRPCHWLRRSTVAVHGATSDTESMRPSKQAITATEGRTVPDVIAPNLPATMPGPVAAREMAAASSLSVSNTLLVPARRASHISRRGLPRHLRPSRSLRAHTRTPVFSGGIERTALSGHVLAPPTAWFGSAETPRETARPRPESGNDQLSTANGLSRTSIPNVSRSACRGGAGARTAGKFGEIVLAGGADRQTYDGSSTLA